MTFVNRRITIATVVVLLTATTVRANETAELPLTRIVAYTAGVAFCEHAATVEGDAEVVLEFPVENIDDVLKSLVILDLDGGKTSLVMYENQEPVARALGSLRIDLSRNPSMADLLQQLRGQRVEITISNTIEGHIVGVETRPQPAEETTVDADFLLLRTEAGLRTVPLSEIRLLRLLDESLDADFQQALELLASNTGDMKRTVTIRFRGEGKRRVRVGYIREFPVWKTTYRLVVKDEGKALLQGWAIVENTTLGDWEDVDLALVSGRPISFRMNLYQPLYVQRPLVAPELFAGLAPRVYDQDLFAREDRRAGPSAMGGFGGGGGAFGGGFGGGGMGGGAFGDPFGPSTAASEPMTAAMEDALLDSQGEMVSAEEVGELFRYKIDVPVSLRREQSAMVPIIAAEIDADRVAIYNPSVHAKHPLSGLRLKNTTELDWMQGPLAVFDGGEFAGDARIGHLPPGEERLVSYALDLATEVTSETKATTSKLTEVKLVDLAIKLSQRHERVTNYVIRNSSNDERQLLVERPFDANWELNDPADEKTRNLHRFAVDCPPGKTTQLQVGEHQVREKTTMLDSLNDRAVARFLEMRDVPDEVKQVLRTYADRKKALLTIREKMSGVNSKLMAIAGEQDRIRKNMSTLDRSSTLYERYLQKLNEQESQIEQFRSEAASLQEEEAEAEASLLKSGD